MLLSFLPDPNRQPPTLPSPGRGASLEAKFTVGEGAAHAVWKRVEGERARVEAARNRGEEEALREWAVGRGSAFGRPRSRARAVLDIRVVILQSISVFADIVAVYQP